MTGSEAVRIARALALAAPLALLGGAYVAQYGFGLFPCEMCWWQRYPHFVAVALATAAFLLSPGRGLIALSAVAIGVVAAFVLIPLSITLGLAAIAALQWAYTMVGISILTTVYGISIQGRSL